MADLMGYLPPDYDENVEMNELMTAENPEIDALDTALMQVQNNQFILTADDARIRQWEKLLRLRPDYAQQSLEYRKAIVLMRLSTRLPLTYRWLKEKAAETGSGEHMIKLIHDLYQLTVRLDYDDRELANELLLYLREKIPANLGLSMEVFFEIESALKLYITPCFNQVKEKIHICHKPLQGEIAGRIFYGHLNRHYCRVIIH